ncbi:MAG TPA: DUF4340 domain-containing protein [Geminicoccus sp.]|jgi:hypothetical protein|uniref:DUF4340 domain-containing protein n=1 Tax=Geminicoccus sp. TaxID=2024832 RepID=UPI002E3213C6|nr:DUF4340 domain-containing protein [Geminicoccus sp.]HEX2524769.1 DUF4340 domain-containing protein [Geminicoccus sp.]
MQPRNFTILVAITGVSVVLAAGALLIQDRPLTSTALNQLLAPDLAARINDVGRIQVIGSEGAVTVERREAGNWVVVEKGGFAADEKAVLTLLRKLGELRVVEAKTALPERLPRLELEDPKVPEAKSHGLVLQDQAGTPIASLVVGKRAFGMFGPGQTGTYVRFADASQAYLTDSEITLPAGATEWISSEVIDLPEDRVKLVSLEPENGVLVTASRASADAPAFDLAGIPTGQAADQAKLGELARLFSQLSLLDVRPAAEVAFYEAPQRVRVETFDGLTVVFTWLSLPEASWLKVDTVTAADTAAPEVKEEAARIAARTEGWAFHVGGYITEQLSQKLDDLLVKPEES